MIHKPRLDHVQVKVTQYDKWSGDLLHQIKIIITIFLFFKQFKTWLLFSTSKLEEIQLRRERLMNFLYFTTITTSVDTTAMSKIDNMNFYLLCVYQMGVQSMENSAHSVHSFIILHALQGNFQFIFYRHWS